MKLNQNGGSKVAGGSISFYSDKWRLYDITAVIEDYYQLLDFVRLLTIGVLAIFGQGGGRPFAQKILANCPNFYKTVEKKQGPYDATT